MAAFSSGTVTFLFTDIEGSTRSWDDQPDAMSEALARHDAILRYHVEAQGGVVFKMGGDACCAAFGTAPEGLKGAVAAQQALAAEPWGQVGVVSVRAALHTGAAEERDGDYFGPPLNRVARLLAAGHGGQILLSASARELVRDRLPREVALLDLGEHRLRDLTRPEHVFQVVAPGLRDHFAPLRTLEARPNNLPIQATTLIGREREVREICRILRPADSESEPLQPDDEDVSVLTLTGPAGTGKTRLALHAAAELLDGFDDGVFFVPLAPVTDPAQVPGAIAAALDVREVDGRPIEEMLLGYLRRKKMLLVLDNFEQIIDAAPTVADIVRNAPEVKILATSRTPLQIYGECQYAVGPMSVPDLNDLPPLERLSQFESVALFIQRARAARRDFAITDENAPAVAEICSRLDGLPLAIELAAARIDMLTPEAILNRLHSRLTLLTRGSRDLSERHRTLRAAIDWSYALLDETEQKLFRQLGVFVGGWTLDAAEAVCSVDADVSTFEGIALLFQKSLVREIGGTGGEPRFDMLATIREFACERLDAAGESGETSERNARYFLGFMEEADAGLRSGNQVQWVKRVAADRDNRIAAIDLFIASGAGEPALRMAAASYWYWALEGRASEGISQIDAALHLDGNTLLSRARALTAVSYLQHEIGDRDVARNMCSKSVRLARKAMNLELLGECLSLQGFLECVAGSCEAGRILLTEALECQRGVQDTWGIGWTLTYLGVCAGAAGDDEEAEAFQAQSLEVASRENVILRYYCQQQLGMLKLCRGEYQEAHELLHQSLEGSLQLCDRAAAASARTNLAWNAVERGEYSAGEAYLRESMSAFRELSMSDALAANVEIAGNLAWARGRALHAARLWSAANKWQEQTGTQWFPSELLMHKERVQSARAACDADAWRGAWEKGVAVSLDDAVALAMGELEPDAGCP